VKKSEIVVGGLYKARVSTRIVTVRVDRIANQTKWSGRACTTYFVTNLATGREVTFRSAGRFRGIAQMGVDHG